METLRSLIEQYLDAAACEKKLSPDTIKAYRIDLKQFAAFADDTMVNKEVLSQYIKYLNQQFAPRSVKRKLASVRAFYNELSLSGTLEVNPFDKLRVKIHSPQQLPRTIPQQIVKSLLQNAYDAYSPGKLTVLRDIVVLELLFSTGLRVSELCSLTKEQFLLNNDGLRLLVNGKGSKERIIQIATPELLRVMQIYCSEYAEDIQTQGAILYNRNRQPLTL